MKPFTHRVLVSLCLALLLGGCEEILGPSSDGPNGDATAIFGVVTKYYIRDSSYANGLKAAIVEKDGGLLYWLFSTDGQIASERSVIPGDIEQDEVTPTVATLLGETYVFEKYNELEPIELPLVLGRGRTVHPPIDSEAAVSPSALTVLMVRTGPGPDQLFAHLIFREIDETGEQLYRSIAPSPVTQVSPGVFQASTLQFDTRFAVITYSGTLTSSHIPDIPEGSQNVTGMTASKFSNYVSY